MTNSTATPPPLDSLPTPRLLSIAAVVSDMDGTLLSPDHTLPRVTADAIRAVESKTEILFMTATGRCRESAQLAMTAESFDLFKRPGVYLNGTVCYGADGRVKAESTVPVAVVKEVIEEFRSDDPEHTQILLCSGDSTVAANDTKLTDKLHDIYNDPKPRRVANYDLLAEEATEIPVHLASVVTSSVGPMDPSIKERVLAVVQKYGCQLAQPLPFLVNVLPPGVCKGHGVAELLKAEYGISMDNVLAIGDANNDIEMVRDAGVGVAMGNATECLKMQADATVSSNGAEVPGVAQVIQKLLSIQRGCEKEEEEDGQSTESCSK